MRCIKGRGEITPDCRTQTQASSAFLDSSVTSAFSISQTHLAVLILPVPWARTHSSINCNLLSGQDVVAGQSVAEHGGRVKGRLLHSWRWKTFPGCSLHSSFPNCSCGISQSESANCGRSGGGSHTFGPTHQLCLRVEIFKSPKR